MRVADVLKIGIGPSSSHTMGPMRAAARFIANVPHDLRAIARVRVELFGSLALTGRGHATDRGIILGLAGRSPASVDPLDAETVLADASGGVLRLAPGIAIDFDIERDIVFNAHVALPFHSNGMRFCAMDDNQTTLYSGEFFSVGGGAVVGEGFDDGQLDRAVPFPFNSAAELLTLAKRDGRMLWEIVTANEHALAAPDVLADYLAIIWQTMEACAKRGLHTEGILPGGLNVRRRAARLYAKYLERTNDEALRALDYVNTVAMAVNEENAAGGRVVTAPTNGAAGVIPAVLHYYRDFVTDASTAGMNRFLLTAAVIGMLYKQNASISGAEVGCQGEVGVACSMAAAGLVAALNGTNEQAEHAAEIGMEHHLGMTCDPIGGLVQIPCIERNAVGAVKAINAARLAMSSEEHNVSLDHVIAVMYRTGLDMQSKYKETSLGGLAVGVVEC